jgi:recombination associated protein RdgC
MLFKQLQIFKLSDNFSIKASTIEPQMSAMQFKPCPPSFSSNHGWVPPLRVEHGALSHNIGHFVILCAQFEEKILPASVVRKEVDDKVKKIELEEDRKVYSKEKKTMREETTMTLLPKAFSKFSDVYAYIDTKNNLLMLNTIQADKTKTFLSLFKKTFSTDPKSLSLKKISYIMTQWVNTSQWPTGLDIMQQATLQDPNNVKRVLRCQQQNLFSDAMQSFIKDGHQIKELAMSWQDSFEFILTDKLLLKSLRYSDDMLNESQEEIEGAEQRFDSNFIIMAELLSQALPILMLALVENTVEVESEEEALA